MTKILALTDSSDDIRNFCEEADTLFFRLHPLPPTEHTYERFYEMYRALKSSCDLSIVDVVIAEYVEAVPLVYFMRRDGYNAPALMIPHSNPYPLNLLFYFLLVAELSHPQDLVICGSENAVRAYEHLTGIPAANICTFGIKDVYGRQDRSECRQLLGLPQDRQILLYTGRFMNDKGLGALLSGYHLLRKDNPSALLVMSVTHIDPPYYNRLAAQMEDVLLFHRLEKWQTASLYNAADLFVSGATSIFETYGKSPLEALACGIPAVVPRWDGFPYFIDDTNGGLVDVDYLDHSNDNPYEFARMSESHFATVCQQVLERPDPFNYRVPEWARYDRTMKVLPGVLKRMAGSGFRQEPTRTHKIDKSRYPNSVTAILEHYGLAESEDLLAKADRLGLIDRSEGGKETLLRNLHHDLFGVMVSVTDAPLRSGSATR
ncbi:glycosyltransferase family 4 protein [Streptomyces sp. NPDC005438]|uniref:glycosyltransferase family 4 protein n=1 Tax=Streptomyces sp. NPDC005438 TaxID=3156880 RepID=UPI0033A82015